jgi:hypothetical protein
MPESSFDEGWLFCRGDASGAEAVSFDDGAWRELDLPHDWSIEDLPYASSAEGDVTADPSLLVPEVPATEPVPPPVTGPFDARSAGDGAVGYTVGGIGWYRRHRISAAPATPSCGSTASTRTRTSGSTACTWASTPTATRRSRST